MLFFFFVFPRLQVDIFALGSCLYELLTLRGLPPSDISEPEYKHMLQAGKRAQFYSKVYTYGTLYCKVQLERPSK